MALRIVSIGHRSFNVRPRFLFRMHRMLYREKTAGGRKSNFNKLVHGGEESASRKSRSHKKKAA